MDLDVADCLARVRRQDQDAARSLVEYLYPTVIRIVRGNLPRRAAEEDLAQDIFVKVFEKLDQFHGEVPLEHWVSRIAVNRCLNAAHAQKVRPEWRMADLSPDQTAALDAAVSGTVDEPHSSQLLADKSGFLSQEQLRSGIDKDLSPFHGGFPPFGPPPGQEFEPDSDFEPMP